MNERQKDYFRQKLTIWRDDILKEAKDTLQHLQDENQNHPDLADRASSETDRAIELRARDRQRKLISKIDAALHRIDDGSYGYCEETGEPIGTEAPGGAPDRNAFGRGPGAPRAPRADLSGRLRAVSLNWDGSYVMAGHSQSEGRRHFARLCPGHLDSCGKASTCESRCPAQGRA